VKDLQKIKTILQQKKEEIRKKYGVIVLGIFGSLARGEQTQTSDVDILVEIEKPIGLGFFELWDNLEKLLGCEVDIVRVKLLRKEIKEEVLKEMVRI